MGFVFHQAAQMTSSRVITHLFLPRLKWEWHPSSAPKQVLSCLWVDRWIVAEASLLSEWYCHMCVLHRPKCRHGEGLGWAGRNRGYCEDGEQGQILHWVPFFLPRRYGLTPKETFMFYVSLMQRCGKKYIAVSPNAETRRSSENDSQSCNVPGFLKLGWSFKQLPKVRGSVCLEMCENTAAKNVNLHLVFFYSFFQSCLTWRLFGISTCCSLSSHVTGLSHTVGHSANWPFLIDHSVPNITPGLQICNLTQCNA